MGYAYMYAYNLAVCEHGMCVDKEGEVGCVHRCSIRHTPDDH